MSRLNVFSRVVVFIVFLGYLAISSLAQSPAIILAQIERLASLGLKEDRILSASIAWQIDGNPKGIAPLLLQKLKEPTATESQKATYAWALGWSKDPSAIDALMALYRGSGSSWIQGNCLRALAMIGGQTAGEFFLSILDAKSDEDERYSILNWLCEMQYEPALSRTEDILRLDPEEYSWKSKFVYGKMGDKAVPFLLAKINSEDLNVRTHAISLLGGWLMAPEAAQALRERFWVEQDAELQVRILSSIERTVFDFDQLKEYFEQAKAKGKNESAIKFAGETLAGIDAVRTAVAEFVGKQKVSQSDFDREYSRLFKSAGHEGDYDVLGTSSSLKDEPRLKKLREHILQRNSDESFYDYEKVNNIIMFNRFAARMKDKKSAEIVNPPRGI